MKEKFKYYIEKEKKLKLNQKIKFTYKKNPPKDYSIWE